MKDKEKKERVAKIAMVLCCLVVIVSMAFLFFEIPRTCSYQKTIILRQSLGLIWVGWLGGYQKFRMPVIEVKVNDKIAKVTILKKQSNKLKTGDEVIIKYKIGGITGEVYNLQFVAKTEKER